MLTHELDAVFLLRKSGVTRLVRIIRIRASGGSEFQMDAQSGQKDKRVHKIWKCSLCRMKYDLHTVDITYFRWIFA